MTYHESLTTDKGWVLIEELREWATYLSEEGDPGSDYEYTSQQIRKAADAIQRLIDERDALIKISETKENWAFPGVVKTWPIEGDA